MFLALDENGYGPILGPLVATGIAGSSDLKKNWPGDIFDSKKLFSSATKLAKIEKIALSIFMISNSRMPKNIFELFEPVTDNKSCKPDGCLCWNTLPDIPFCAKKSEIESYAEYLESFLKKNSISVTSITSMALCVKEFNNLCRKNFKKDYINYLLFEKIMNRYKNCGNMLTIMAGKIGGRKTYTEFLKYGFVDWKIIKKNEYPEISTYLLSNNNSLMIINFIKDLESKSFLGVLSGIYGKYVRELLMTGINKSLCTETFISGYRDKNTKEFIRKLQLKMPAFIDCIIRIK